MLKWYRADLHVHTVLSPCGDLLMGPKNIIERATQVGLNGLAITDHNASGNVLSVMKAAEKKGLLVIPGMEVTTKEEAHLICLFSELEQLIDFQALVYDNLPPGKNDPEFFGHQYIVNEKNEVIRENSRLLIFATALTAYDIVEAVSKRRGICYPAHIDRKAYSLLNQLGFIPEDLVFPALEISWNVSVSTVTEKFPEVAAYPLIRPSDAHHTDQLGRGVTWFYLEELTYKEIVMAICGEGNRKVYIEKEI